MNNQKDMNRYLASAAMVKEMLFEGVISEQDLEEVEKLLNKKYGIKDNSLYRQNCLIKTPTRVMYVEERSKNNG